MNNKFCRLLLIGINDPSKKGCAGQSNKFYEMSYTGGNNFTVKYGRVESTAQNGTYHISQWNSKYNEKIKKGYKDVTDLVADIKEEIVEDTVEIIGVDDKVIEKFLLTMKKYTDNLVSKVYSIKATSVTKAQVDNAQEILDELANLAKAKKLNVNEINNKLISLYTVIPRYIKDVRKEVLPYIDLNKTLSQEQDNLDAMASQVRMIQPKKDVKKQKISLLDKLGVKILKVEDYTKDKELKKYVDQIGKSKIKTIFAIQKDTEEKTFKEWLNKQTNKTTCTVIHGTKCASVISILEQSLKIRPAANFQFNGKVYGNGNYFSEEWSTSSGYTDYNGSDKVLLVYEAHVGKPSYTSASNYNEIKRTGHDSFAMKGRGGLHVMRVLYREEQSLIKYVIWL